jgi:acetolactate synthase-1/2/3 large subunit
METAVRYGINTVTVINNNHSLNQEKRGNERAYESVGVTGNVDELWVFPDTDFAKLAEDMGGFGIRVERPEELQDAMKEAAASNKPSVVDVVTDIEGIAPRAWVG